MTPPTRPGYAEREEIWLVLWVCGGLSVIASLAQLLQNPAGPILFTTPRLLGTVSIEVCLAIAFVPFLRARGWRLRDITRPFQFYDLLLGIAIFAAMYLLYVLMLWVARAGGPAVMALFTGTRFRAQPLSLVAVVLRSVINPIFEEFLYFGYAFNALRRHSVRMAFAVAVLLRIAVHVYQGWLALAFIAPLAIVFTFFFLRTNRIWPVIVAHAIQDFVALSALSTHATSQ